jgi:hypothetical protein
MPRTNPRYPRDFREEAVRLARSGNRTVERLDADYMSGGPSPGKCWGMSESEPREMPSRRAILAHRSR